MESLSKSELISQMNDLASSATALKLRLDESTGSKVGRAVKTTFIHYEKKTGENQKPEKHEIEKTKNDVKKFEGTISTIYYTTNEKLRINEKGLTVHQKAIARRALYENYPHLPQIFKKHPDAELKMIESCLIENPEISTFEMLQNVKKGEEIFNSISKGNELPEELKSNPQNVKCLYWFLTAVAHKDNTSYKFGDALRFVDKDRKIIDYLQKCPECYKRVFKPFSDSTIQKNTEKFGLTVPGLPGNKKSIVFDSLIDGTAFVKSDNYDNKSVWGVVKKIIFSFFSFRCFQSEKRGEPSESMKNEFMNIFDKKNKETTTVLKGFLTYNEQGTMYLDDDNIKKLYKIFNSEQDLELLKFKEFTSLMRSGRLNLYKYIEIVKELLLNECMYNTSKMILLFQILGAGASNKNLEKMKVLHQENKEIMNSQDNDPLTIGKGIRTVVDNNIKAKEIKKDIKLNNQMIIFFKKHIITKKDEYTNKLRNFGMRFIGNETMLKF